MTDCYQWTIGFLGINLFETKLYSNNDIVLIIVGATSGTMSSGIKYCMGQGKCPDDEACNNDCIGMNFESGHCVAEGCCCYVVW